MKNDTFWLRNEAPSQSETQISIFIFIFQWSVNYKLGVNIILY